MSMRYPGGLIAPNPVNQQFPSGVWTGPQSAPYQANNVWANDSSFKNTTLLLHGDGATTPFIKDASTNNFQITLNGDTKPNNLTPFIENGYWSNYFDGSGDYLSVSSNTAFDFAGDFTVEGYFYFLQVNQVAGATILFNTNVLDRFQLAIENNVITLRINGSLVINTAYTSASLLNTWTHIAAVRTGSTVAIFVNGTRLATGTSSATPDNSVAYIGVQTPGYSNHYFNGYMSSLRVVNGSGPYNATQTTLTVPTSPLTAITNTSLLTCQSNRFVDNSTNALAITVAGDTAVSMQQPFTAPSGTSLYGSGYFDGSGDYLAPATSSAFAFGTGDLTFECWIYVPVASDSPIYESRSTNSNTDGFTVTAFSSTVIRVYTNGVLVTATVSNYLNAWTHVAYTRQGSTNRLFVNGVLGATATASDNFSNTTAFIGAGRYASSSISAYFTGYISNVRILKGTAQYTATFTPPTAPLTAITNTSLLTLQTNGPSTNNGFLDSSYNSFPVTRNGNTTQGTFTPYGSNWSNAFATSAAIRYPYTSSLTSWWTQDFTMEMWIFNNTNAVSGTNSLPLQFAHGTYTAASTYWSFGTNASGQLNFYYYNGGPNNVTSTTTASLGTWNHIAMVYTHSSGNISLYLNGASVASATKSGTPQNYSGDTVNIGAVQSTYYNGYISNLRVLNGTALYTGTFTPSTAPLTAITNTQLLTCQSNRFKDNSTNNATPTLIGTPTVQRFAPFAPTVQYTPQVFGGSGYFDGSGDYFTVPTSNAFNFTGDATCECWIYPNALSTNSQLFGFNNGVSDLKWIGVLLSTSGAVSGAATAGAGGSFTSANGVVGVGRWHHIAWVKNGATVYLYVNGVQVASGASSAVYAYQASPLLIGRLDGNNSLCFNGYMADMRIVKTAVYTSAFTPPTAPLTPIANTQLLLSMTNAAIFDNSGMNDLETVGNAKISTSVVKYGTGSMYFDGSGDRLYEPSTQNFNFGTVDFTIELWVNPISQGGHGSSNNDCLVDFRPGSTGVYGTLYIYSSGTGVYWYVNGSNRITGGAILNGVWTHIAVCRASGNTKLFLNGVQSGSTYADTNNYLVAPIMIGEFNDGTGGGNFYGYIDDLRITKGVARYVTNFTPPVARMPNQ